MKETENIKAITDFLFIENDIDELKLADLVMVLCNDNIRGIAEVIDDLFKRNIIDDNSCIVISGKHGKLNKDSGIESERVCDKLVNEYGYDEKLFVLEKKATNVYENLAFSKELIDDVNKYQNILVIGAAFALRRIKMCASGMGYPVERMQFVGTVNSERRICGKDNWWINDNARIRVYQELERIGKYLVKGDLDIK